MEEVTDKVYFDVSRQRYTYNDLVKFSEQLLQNVSIQLLLRRVFFFSHKFSLSEYILLPLPLVTWRWWKKKCGRGDLKIQGECQQIINFSLKFENSKVSENIANLMFALAFESLMQMEIYDCTNLNSSTWKRGLLNTWILTY